MYLDENPTLHPNPKCKSICTIQTYLTNTFETAQGDVTISVIQTGEYTICNFTHHRTYCSTVDSIIQPNTHTLHCNKTFQRKPTWRVLSHLRKFLKTGQVSRNNRGDIRDGQSLLSCESFKQKASLWVKEQIALHTQRRLRVVRKSASFKSQ